MRNKRCDRYNVSPYLLKGIAILLLATAVWLVGWKEEVPLTITFLDVGQGDCIVVRTTKETYLFDCGSTDEEKAAEYILLPYLRYQGISRLDGVFVSHADEDHTNGITELLLMGSEGIEIGKLILPDVAPSLAEKRFAKLQQALRYREEHIGKDKTPSILLLSEGDTWQSGDVVFHCLHPQKHAYLTEDNEYSMCVLVGYRDFGLLLTGDVEGEGERQLTERLQEKLRENLWEERGVTLLKVAHHGSSGSTSEAFLEIARPALAVISCGENNAYGHPHKETIDRLRECGAQIFSTPACGQITIKVKKDKVRVECYKYGESTGQQEDCLVQ